MTGKCDSWRKILVIELCVNRWYICNDIWEEAIEEQPPCEGEPRNVTDRYAVAVTLVGLLYPQILLYHLIIYHDDNIIFSTVNKS